MKSFIQETMNRNSNARPPKFEISGNEQAAFDEMLSSPVSRYF